MLPKNVTEALRMVAENTFAQFNDADWETFSGCETESPLVCYLEGEENLQGDRNGISIVIDGSTLYFQTLNHIDETSWKSFRVVEE
jgi:hypothetical protein